MKVNTKFISCTLMFLCLSLMGWAQESIHLHGQVTDAGGAPLPGASVLIKGTLNGTVTKEDGHYTLETTHPHPTLLFSFQGFATQEVSVEDSEEINIRLVSQSRQLNDVVVTATRSAKELENVPQKMKVIDGAEIEKTIAPTMTDLLKKTAGVDVIEYPGLLSGIGIRGFRPEYSGINQRTLLLIDGHPAGTTNLSTIDMSSIERVEVMKGPASALYGSQAMGGVVNLITKKTKGAIKGKVYTGLGSFSTTKAGFNVGGDIMKDLDFNASFSNYTRAKNYKLGEGNLFRDAFGWDKADRILWTEEGKQDTSLDDARGDGSDRPYTTYTKYTAAARLGYNISEHWRVDVSSNRFYANHVTTADDIAESLQSPGLKDLDRYGSDVIAVGDLSASTQLTAKAFTSQEKVTNYTVSVDESSAIQTQYVSSKKNLTWNGGQLFAHHQIHQHAITAGIDYTLIEQNNHSYASTGEVKSISASSPNFDQSNTGIYAQGDLNFLAHKLNINAGVRYEIINYQITGTEFFDAREETSNVVNPSFGVNYNFTNGFTVHGTFGTGFTTVDIFDIAGYYESSVSTDTVDVYRGNPNLKNQQSKTYDLGMRYTNHKGLWVDVTFFNTWYENAVLSKVTTYPNQTAESGAVIRNLNTYTNAKDTRINGIEFDASYDFGVAAEAPYSMRVFANGTHILKAEEIREIYLQDEPLTMNMHNVAATTVNYGFSFDNLKWFSAQLSGRYVGRRYDTDWSYYLSSDNVDGYYADVHYPAFMVLDLATSVRKDVHELALKVGNLTDENYYEKRGYNLLGRNFMLEYILHL